MTSARILTTFALIDLLIIAGVMWCALHGMPVRLYFIPAAALFLLNSFWLLWIMLKKTPRR